MFLSLVDLMEDKPFSDITVEEIIRTSMISRGTFYRYVSDKKSLLMFGVSHYIDEVIKEMGFPDSKNMGSLSRIIDLLILTLEKRGKMFHIILGPNAPYSVEKYLFKRISHYFKFYIFQRIPDNTYYSSRDYLSILSTNIIIGFLKKWPTLSQDQKLKMTDYFYNFSRNGLTGLINNKNI